MLIADIKRDISENRKYYFLALICVYGNGSWLYYDYNKLYSALLIVVFFIFVVKEGIKNNLDSPNIFVILLIGIPILSTIVNISAKQNIINLVSTSILTILLCFFKKDILLKILDKYATIIFLLAIISIPLGIFFLFYPENHIIPITASQNFGIDGGGFYNLLVFTDKLQQDYRTQSIFWEPGAWAINQSFAFFWYAYYKKDLSVWPIFLLSMILTLSTTGLALFFGLTLWLLIKPITAFSRRIIVKWLIVIVPILFVCFTYVLVNYQDEISLFIYLQTTGKFDEGTLTHGSLAQRNETFNEAWNIGVANPLFGQGRTTDLYVTSTIAQVLYQTGVPYTIIYMLCFLQFLLKTNVLFAIPYMIIMLQGEVYGFYSLNTILIVLGTKNIRKQ